MRNVVVIGGGASGMMAALTAAEDRNNSVILIERQPRVGKKLLATGNGRCNMTNTETDIRHFHGSDSGFAESALSQFPPYMVMDYFKSLGLIPCELYGGRVFPLSDSANSVVDVLRYSLISAGVDIFTDSPCEYIKKKENSFIIKAGEHNIVADNVIVACGGKAGGKVGGVSDGYEILKSFGHTCTALYPSLVPILIDSDYPRSLKGVRADCHIMLFNDGKLRKESRGEVQFTETGISGPCAFDISRDASINGGNVIMDFIEAMSEYEIFEMLRSRKNKMPDLEAGSILTGIVHNRLSLVIVKYCGLKPSDMIKSLEDNSLRKIAEACKNLKLKIKGVANFDAAQITVGGIRTSEFDPKTLQSKKIKGLYACGEVLDIDADCGGFNLQWAWASGHLAGKLL